MNPWLIVKAVTIAHRLVFGVSGILIGTMMLRGVWEDLKDQHEDLKRKKAMREFGRARIDEQEKRRAREALERAIREEEIEINPLSSKTMPRKK